MNSSIKQVVRDGGMATQIESFVYSRHTSSIVSHILKKLPSLIILAFEGILEPIRSLNRENKSPHRAFLEMLSKTNDCLSYLMVICITSGNTSQNISSAVRNDSKKGLILEFGNGQR